MGHGGPRDEGALKVRLAAFATILAGCYSSYSLTGAPDAGSAECGNGVVEPPEQCDLGVGPCTGDSACPGFRMCRDDCTWGGCLDGGFGVLAGPVLLTGADAPLGEVTRANTTWTGSRYGIVYSGNSPTTADPWAAMFAAVSPLAELSVPPHRVLPGMFSLGEVHAAYRAGDDRYGLVMVARGGAAHGMVNLADPDGWVLIDPGIGLGANEPMDVFVVDDAAGYAASWAVRSGAGEIWVATYDPGLNEGMRARLTPVGSTVITSLPLLLADGSSLLALWHGDDAGGTNRSFIELQGLEHGSPPTGPAVRLFEDMQAVPPFSADLAADRIWIAFSVQPYFDAPVLDVYLAQVHASGSSISSPVKIGLAWRGARHDVDLAWSGTEVGLAVASPIGEDPMDPQRVITFYRHGPDNTMLADPVTVYPGTDAYLPDVVWDGTGYGLTWAVTSESDPGVHDVMFARIGCLPAR